ncbi:MAG: hypothetical protein ACKOCO_05930 [Bacteroidota bacterium]
MFRSLFKVALMALAAILVYNYFWGTDEEQEQSRKVFGQLRGVVESVSEIVVSEKAKFDAGKYDRVLEQLGDTYKTVRQHTQHVDGKIIQRLDELEARKSALQSELDAIEQLEKSVTPPAQSRSSAKKEKNLQAEEADRARRRELIRQKLETLLRDSDSMLRDAEQ